MGVRFDVKLGAVGVALCLAGSFAWMAQQVEANQAAGTGGGEITGVVQSSEGSEAGVWVIAETEDLATTFVKIVVTDDEGRYLLPDLPEARYDVWVRGYGLVDSPRVKGMPGQELTLTAVLAPSPVEAAKVYPANYWYSLIEVPAKSEFPGTGPNGNGIPRFLGSQAQWINSMKQGCQGCHQLGNRITREIDHRDRFDSTLAAWDHRVRTGQRGAGMSGAMSGFGRQRGLAMYADWTDRIAAGEVPPAPPRPQGIERNLVLTMWDWAVETAYVHDMISSDKRNPQVNANGPVYGVSGGHGKLIVVDPHANTATELQIPTRLDPDTITSRWDRMYASRAEPSYYYGDEQVWADPADPHNPMMDGKGRVWMTAAVRGPDTEDWCREGSDHPSATYFPINQSARNLSYFDPATQKFVLVDTCYATHHLQFAEDADDTLWLSGDTNVIGWLNTRVLDETGDERAAQGWCPTVVDTNGDGQITRPWNEPGEPIDPTRDTRTVGFAYGVIPDRMDDTVWVARAFGSFPGTIVRLERGDNPPETCIAEVYEPPIDNPMAEVEGHSPRGIDIDRNGLIWTALSGSGHLASFDRSKCRVLRGPEATGQHCPEGWRLYPTPGPQMKGVTDSGSADFHYYNWVDHFNILGLGENVPIANGTGSDSLLALKPDTGEWVVLRVPYPLGFFSRALDGRIDDPNGGWKGRGVWASYSGHFNWHIEGGKGTKSKIVHFQLRPHPLAN